MSDSMIPVMLAVVCIGALIAGMCELIWNYLRGK